MSASSGPHDAAEDRTSPGAEDPPARLGGVRGIAHDDEERPSREDRGYGQTIFTRRPVPFPKWLGGGKKKDR
ncbi:MAG TPA: hypothetical protein VFM58_13960 [Solirubrobacteraceae bacterium]|nr:hypothetical protein [Solirubrobacteraceae bacterium]